MNHLAVDSRKYGYAPTADVLALYRKRVLPHLRRRRSVVRYTLSHHECMAGHDMFAAVARVVLGLRIFAQADDLDRIALVFVAPRFTAGVGAAKDLRDTCERNGVPVTARFDVHGVSRLVLHHGRTTVLFAAASVDNVAGIERLAAEIDTLVIHAPERIPEDARAAIETRLAPRARTQLVLTALRRVPANKTRRRVKARC
jgi:hypothetical protein